MDPLQDLAARLVGTWRAVLVSDEKVFSYFRILDDLRYVGIMSNVPPSPRHPYVDMRLWCELESASTLRMKLKKDRPGDIRDLHFEGETLVLQYNFRKQEGETVPRKYVWRCHRLTDEEIPEWFEPQFAKAMAKPWK